jgi:hypothetical protein
MFVIIFIALLILFIFLRVNSTKIKGSFGERNVAARLSFLNPNEYKIFNDLLLRTNNNNTVQIDHLVISIYGIFVIETKNYKGWIFGNENVENWMQIIYKEKHQFRNPIKQNWSHIYALKEILKDYKNIRYFPIVVFVGSAELKEIQTKRPVLYSNKLFGYIKSQSIVQNLSQEDIPKIISLLETKNIGNKENKKEHIQNIHKTTVERKIKTKNLICPRCNSELKLREGKYGKFYGCLNYPYCKFTMKY